MFSRNILYCYGTCKKINSYVTELQTDFFRQFSESFLLDLILEISTLHFSGKSVKLCKKIFILFFYHLRGYNRKNPEKKFEFF